MKYFVVKLKWNELKPGTDQIKKVSKQFIVNAHSVTEAELKITNWCPGNYQEAVVEDVKKTNISSITIQDTSDIFWLVKTIEEVADSKPKTILELFNGSNIEILFSYLKKKSIINEIDAITKCKVIVEEDLIKDEVILKEETEL